jgi:hypothetical protein
MVLEATTGLEPVYAVLQTAVTVLRIPSMSTNGLR